MNINEYLLIYFYKMIFTKHFENAFINSNNFNKLSKLKPQKYQLL